MIVTTEEKIDAALAELKKALLEANLPPNHWYHISFDLQLSDDDLFVYNAGVRMH